jgi:DNA-binding NarL/FixJ family response regulator
MGIAVVGTLPQKILMTLIFSEGADLTAPISIAILDDHQGIIDGYLFRLSQAADIQVSATLMFGDDLEPALERQKIDVLILDVSVPTSATNPNPYPLLYLIPKLIDRYPQLVILVISMHNQRTLVRAVLEAGASGYILKDDRTAILNLPAVIRLVHSGGIYLSQPIADLIKAQKEASGALLTPRQTEVLSFCVAYPDLSTAEIAQRMKISHSTVRNLLSGAYLRLEVSNRAAAIARARASGLFPQE